MPFRDMLVLGFIVLLFASFGIVLAATCWYCRRTGEDVRGAFARRNAHYPTGGRLITDDD